MNHPEKCYKVISKKYAIDSIESHWHDFYEIEVVICGDGKHIINGKEYVWKTGHIYFLRTTDFHRIDLTKRGFVHQIQFTPFNMPPEVLSLINDTTGNIATYLSQKDFSAVNSLCLMLQDNCDKKKIYNENVASNILYLIVNTIIRSLSDKNSMSPLMVDERITGIINYINDHFKERLSLEEIATKSYLSKNHLCSYFKKEIGITIFSYIKNIRLDYAAKLVVTTDMKSIEICFACGYGSVSNFLRDFRNRFGQSPMVMRKNHNKDNK